MVSMVVAMDSDGLDGLTGGDSLRRLHIVCADGGVAGEVEIC